MKRSTLTLLLFYYFSFSFSQLSEDFESSLTIPTGWTSFIGTNGLGTTENWQVLDNTVNNLAVVRWEAVTGGNTQDWLVTKQFIVDPINFFLSFEQTDFFAGNFNSNYTIRVSTGNNQTTISDFTIVDTQTEADVRSGGPPSQHTIDLSAYIGQSIFIAFVLEQNDGDGWIIDNVEMISNANAPDPATNPFPEDTAINVPIDTTNGNYAVAFSWEAATTGDPATAYDFYLGDSPTNLTLLQSLVGTSTNITAMEYSTQYYWQIISKNVGGEASGSSVWSFTTEVDPSLSNDEFSLSKFRMYPNPTNDILNIESSLDVDIVTIYNLLGKQVLSYQKSDLIDNKIDLSNLNQGLYLIKITSGNTSETLKINKN